MGIPIKRETPNEAVSLVPIPPGKIEKTDPKDAADLIEIASV